ncbi:MAG: hypothetical protein ACRCYT_05045 [Cetobacterium sp.]
MYSWVSSMGGASHFWEPVLPNKNHTYSRNYLDKKFKKIQVGVDKKFLKVYTIK